MKKITTIIVTYNSEHHIYECLESLFRFNDIGDELEVIVVDNCSRNFDEMKAQLVKRYAEKITIIKNTQNGGYGQGNNVGIYAAHAPYIMIMNPDVRLSEPLFNHVNDVFSKDQNVVIYAATQRKQDGSLGKSTAWTRRIHPYLAESLRVICSKLNIYWQKYMYVSGACFFIRKSSFEKVGLFDEHIFMYNEEDDIHSRLLRLDNARIIYDYKRSYIHLHPAVKDYDTANHKWLEIDLGSLIYMNERDGISKEKTIKWNIKRVNISIWGEKFKQLFGKGNQKRLKYYKDWRECLKQRLKD